MKNPDSCVVMQAKTEERASGPAWLQALLAHARKIGRHSPKRLRVAETVPLGERSFVAVIEFESFRFLVGGTSSSLILLAELGRSPVTPAIKEVAP